MHRIRLVRVVLLLMATVVLRLVGPAAGQPPDLQVRQVLLTNADVKNYIAAQRELVGIIFRMPEDRADLPGMKSGGQVELIVRQHGFSDLEAYNVVARNIALVLEGVDPRTRTFVGADAMLRRQLRDVEADSSATIEEKEAAKSELLAQMKAIAPIAFPENVGLVMRNLNEILANSPFGASAYAD